MAIRIHRSGETIYGQFASGDVHINLPPHQENLLLESGIAVLLEEEDLQIVLAGGSSGATISNWANRANPADVPEGTIIQCPDAFYALFQSTRKRGLADWAPYGGIQLVAQWNGDVACHTANSTPTAILTDNAALIVPGGVMGLYGALEVRLRFANLYNTSSGPYNLLAAVYAASAQKSGAALVYTLMSGYETFLTIQNGVVETAKRAGTLVCGLSANGRAVGPLALREAGANLSVSDGQQLSTTGLTVEADLQFNILTAASNAAVRGRLVSVEIYAKG
jgi:hypothetical protein